MTQRISKALTFAVFAASLLSAQNTQTPPTTAQIVANLVARLTTLLTLTSTQQTQATTIFTTEQTALAALRTSIQTAQTALTTAIKANDQAGIATQATAIGNATTQEVEAQAKADAAFYLILTPEQQTKYNELKSGVGGFGGPGFGGPGPGGRGH